MPLTDSGPVIDGKLDDLCWKKAVSTGTLQVTRPEDATPLSVARHSVAGRKEPPRSGGLRETTEAFISRDADHLYVALSCAGKPFVKEAVKVGKPSKDVEFAELLINSNGDRNSYYLIRITAENGGAVTTSYNEHDPPWRDRTWQPTFRSAVVAGDNGWTAELGLPFNIFNKNKTLASEIGFNVRRAGMAGGEIHSWRHASLATHHSDWGILSGIPARASQPKPDYAKPRPDPSSSGAQWNVTVYAPPPLAQRSFLAEERARTISLGPGSAHP
ncbi:MAG: hypothetical protein FJ388_23210, partial [Verrucomicrobia bacterium]|nr:hypothetical protein [Verrucomicrobiota bacterium]